MDYPAHLLLFLSCFARLASTKRFDVGAAAGAVVADVVASESVGCEFKTTDLSNGLTDLKPEPEATPLKTKFDIRINGLREVKGGSFGVDVEITMTWEDRRYIDANAHREEECKSNHVPYDEISSLYSPNLFLIGSFHEEGYISEPTAGNSALKYDVKSGMFELWTKSFAEVKCPMDYSLYPFDTQKCRFAMRNIAKNLTYEVFETDLIYDEDILAMEEFDISFVNLSEKTFSQHPGEVFSVTGFNVELIRSQTPFYMNVYLPTGLLTIISFIGFLIPVEVVPGRMALLVTVFLMLVNTASVERNRSPTTRSITCMDTWLLLCMIFVALALFEYAFQLAIRYQGKMRGKEDIEEREKASKQRCLAIDRWALRIFAGLYILVIGSYFYFVSQQ